MPRKPKLALHTVNILVAGWLLVGCVGPPTGSDSPTSTVPPTSPDASTGRKSRPAESVDPGLFGTTTVRAVMLVFTLPIGTIARERHLREELDEDAVGVRQRSLLRHNGLLLGMVEPQRRSTVTEKLAKFAIEPPSRSVSLAGPRGRLSLSLVRHQRSRVALFQFGLDGSVSAHQYSYPVGGWDWESMLSPSEPDMLLLSGVPTLQHIRDARYVGPKLERLRAPPDLSPTELLELLPTRREEAAKAAAATAAALGEGDFGPYTTEVLDRLRVSVRVSSGAALVLAPIGDAVGPSRAACAGRVLLTEGPRDVGVEYVLVLSWDFGESARSPLPALPVTPPTPPGSPIAGSVPAEPKMLTTESETAP